MKILKNTLSLKLEIWDDPGDYPSNAAQYPLPSYCQLEDIEGYVIIQIEPVDREADDWNELGAPINLYTMMEDHTVVVNGVRITTWQLCPKVHPDANLVNNLDVWTIIPYEWDDSDFEID